ncbi:platelet-activating factor receptor-like [Pholidichthys leucotaenia]
MEKTFTVTENPGLVSSRSNSSVFLDSTFRYVLIPVVYGIIFILGVFANAYVLFFLRCLRKAKVMAETRIYMINLTIADLLFVSALPFWIGYYSRDGNWAYGDFMCRLTGSFFFINTYSTILFLGAISMNRYRAVTRPMEAAFSDCRCRGIILCVVIWVFTLSMSIPYFISPGTNKDSKNITRCFEGYQDKTDEEKRRVAITHFLIIGMFFIVFFIVVGCNFHITRALLSQYSSQSSSSTGHRGVKWRALQMLWAVVGVFILCFLPHHVIQGPWVLSVLQIKKGFGHVDWDQKTRQAFSDAHQVTLVLMGLNCILDPIVYYFATGKFRKFIIAHIKQLARGEGCSPRAITKISIENRNQSQ